jgi:hypothetical protein
MLVFEDLSPELILCVLEYVPIPTLTTLDQVSKSWQGFMREHESSLYRHLAFLHGYTRSEYDSLEAAKLRLRGGTDWLKDVHSWKALCWYMPIDIHHLGTKIGLLYS